MMERVREGSNGGVGRCMNWQAKWRYKKGKEGQREGKLYELQVREEE